MLLGFFLAADAASGFGAGLQPGGRNADAAGRALSIAAGFDATQCRVNRAKFGRFAFAEGELEFAFGRDLGA
jgi:hypothetical protein